MPTDFELSETARAREYGRKEAIMARHPFTLAFENFEVNDWVTEKVFSAFVAGTVPIYFGAPNIAEFVPPHSVINVRDFDSMRELVQHLLYLQGNATAYQEYLAWRKPPYVWVNTPKLSGSKLHAFCGLCRAVARHFDEPLPRKVFNKQTGAYQDAGA